MRKKFKITTAKQFEALVTELERNPNLAKGFAKGTVPGNFKEMWDEIASKLNAIGPPFRDSDGWQKVWRDFKFKVKRKLTRNTSECNTTGSKRYKQLRLYPLEEAVANLVKFDKQLKLEYLIPAIGMTTQTTECDDSPVNRKKHAEEDSSPSAEEPSLFKNVHSKTAKRKTNPTEIRKHKRQCLPEKCNKIQDDVFNVMSGTMALIKNTLGDFTQFQEKLVEIEERKLKLLERKNEREEELFQHDIKIQKIKLQIKKKELEMLCKSH